MARELDATTDVTALMLIRVRFEAGSDHPMRAQIRSTRDVTTGFEQSSTVTDIESVIVLLREWLSVSRHAAESLNRPGLDGGPDY